MVGFATASVVGFVVGFATLSVVAFAVGFATLSVVGFATAPPGRFCGGFCNSTSW